MSRLFAAIAALMILSSAAAAQVIHQPVQYQFRAGTPYYYGGSDPRVHERARLPVGGAGQWGRVNGYAFVSGDLNSHRAVRDEPLRAFTDGMPFWNAAIFGFGPDDARNEAYANMPRYYRVENLVAAGHVARDGAIVVPPHAQPVSERHIIIRRTDRERDDVEMRRRIPEPRPTLIIPRRLLEEPGEAEKIVIIPSPRREG
jgi:hypothetical protein